MSNARDFASRVPVDGALSNRNLIINGDFSIWQRSDSHTSEGYGSVDRWTQHYGAGSQLITRIAMNQNRANEIKAACGHVPENFLSYNVTSFSTYSGFRTRLEDIMKVSGQTVTLSIVVASQNNSVISPKLRVWNTSGGISQDIGSTGIATDGVMRRYTWTYDVADVFTVGSTPDGTGFIEIEIYTDRAGWHDYACVQLELGDTATPFEHRSYGDELARCQRYFQRLDGGAYNHTMSDGYGRALAWYPVSMRANPTFTNVGGNGTASTTINRLYVYQASAGANIGNGSSLDAEL